MKKPNPKDYIDDDTYYDTLAEWHKWRAETAIAALDKISGRVGSITLPSYLIADEALKQIDESEQ